MNKERTVATEIGVEFVKLRWPYMELANSKLYSLQIRNPPVGYYQLLIEIVNISGLFWCGIQRLHHIKFVFLVPSKQIIILFFNPLRTHHHHIENI